MRVEYTDALKASRLERLREELSYLVNDDDPQSQAWRQGMLDGRVLELKELGIFDQEDVHAFLDEFSAALWAKKIAKGG